VPLATRLGERQRVGPVRARGSLTVRFTRAASSFSRWVTVAVSALITTLALEDGAHADDPRPDVAKSSAERPEKPKTEFTIVPFVGGNSDMGFGGGYIASLARRDPNLMPYRYRIETAGTVTVGQDDADKLRINYTDVYVLFSLPNLIKDRLALDIRASYTLESNLKYYGLGNASSIDPDIDPTDSYYEHSRAHPTLRATFEYRMRPVALALGASYTQNWFDVPEDSRLASDLTSPDPDTRQLLGNTAPHGTPKIHLGAAWDTRDDGVSPVRGLYITEQIDITPGTVGDVNYRFMRVGTAVNVFVPLLPKDRRLVLATRVVNDLLIGDPPFYELPRFEDTFAIGGAKGVRGVPGQRYYGKIKAFANVELRSELVKAKILGDERRFGLVAFTDFGRVWADYEENPELDGTGLGLKYGIGGGLRVASGETFVLRVDVAWSPDANPISGYLLAGHIF
jgi:hypothetical protein